MFRRSGPGWKGASNGYARHHYWVPTRQKSRKRSADWRPTLAEAGHYRIEVWIPRWHATSRRARYRIATADGWVSRVRNQSKNRGRWVDLGVHRLTKKPIVRLRDKTGERDKLRRRLAYDAMRFTRVPAPAITSPKVRATRPKKPSIRDVDELVAISTPRPPALAPKPAPPPAATPRPDATAVPEAGPSPSPEPAPGGSG